VTRRRRVAVILAAGVALLAVSVVPFVRPQTSEPTRADAVVVLSGDHGERLARAMELLDGGVTSTLVLDGTPDSARWLELCEGGQPFEVVCLRPEPDGTRQEARAAGRLARTRGWEHVVVSTSTHHVTRSAMLFRRCVAGKVDVVASDAPHGGRRMARAIAREWLAVAHLLTLGRGC